MKKLIAHRGNIIGKNTEWENHPDYIEEAIQNGYDVEIDVWNTDWSLLDKRRNFKTNKWFLGHDVPKYKVSLDWLINLDFIEAIWCHAKNIDALYKLQYNSINCFFHNRDAVTLTSEGWLWTYPGHKLTKYSICVMPEDILVPYEKEDLELCYGICSDKIGEYKCFA